MAEWSMSTKGELELCGPVYLASQQDHKSLFACSFLFYSAPQSGCALVSSYFYQNSLQNDKWRRCSQALSAPDVPDGALRRTIWEVVQNRTTANTCGGTKQYEQRCLASDWLKRLFILSSIRTQVQTIHLTKCNVHLLFLVPCGATWNQRPRMLLVPY